MSVVTIRNLAEETHRALKARAIENHRSTEAEIRFILENAVRHKDRVKLGALLAEIGCEVAGVEFEIYRDKTATEPLSFE